MSPLFLYLGRKYTSLHLAIFLSSRGPGFQIIKHEQLSVR
jgi:hypothetical protein